MTRFVQVVLNEDSTNGSDSIILQFQTQQIIDNPTNNALRWDRVLASLTHDTGLGLASRYHRPGGINEECPQCGLDIWCRCGLLKPEMLRRIQNWHRNESQPAGYWELRRRMETQLALHPKPEENKVEESKEVAEGNEDDVGNPLSDQQTLLAGRVATLLNVLTINEDTRDKMEDRMRPHDDTFISAWNEGDWLKWISGNWKVQDWLLVLWWWRRLQTWIMSRQLAGIAALDTIQAALANAFANREHRQVATPYIIRAGGWWTGGFHNPPYTNLGEVSVDNVDMNRDLAMMRFELLILTNVLDRYDLYAHLEGLLVLMARPPKVAAETVRLADGA